uniref:SVWC domain-containing protein n=1 Tax=Glossina brevipalpis TaxID=37001 RepID=A0A1A9W6P8_9MUSC
MKFFLLLITTFVIFVFGFAAVSRGDYSNPGNCGSMAASPPCELGDYVNRSGPYPGCCEREIKC